MLVAHTHPDTALASVRAPRGGLHYNLRDPFNPQRGITQLEEGGGGEDQSENI